MPGKFILKRGRTGTFRFHLLSANGQVLATSKPYETKAAATRGVESVRTNAPDADIDDQTAKSAGAAKTTRAGKKGKIVKALERDWEQTKSDVPGLEGKNLRQDVGDTLKQAAGKQRTPPKSKPNTSR
jgi:uncharacterized protein YegP (UPF0339 family)